MRGTFSPSAIVCGAVVALAELVVVFSRTTWIGFLGYTPEWANAGQYLAGPLIAGACAFISRAHLSPELVALSGGRRWVGASRIVASAWVRTFVASLAAHALVMTVALATSAAFGASGRLAWEPFAYAAMPVAMACAIGLAVGAVFPSRWAAVVAVLVAYAAWYVAATTETVLPVNVGGATISLAGLAYSSEALTVSFLAAAVVTAALLAVAACAVRWQLFGRSLTLLASVLATANVVAALVGGQIGVDRFAAAQHPTFACAGSAPRICLAEEHSARLEATAHGVDAAARVFADAGVDLSGVVLREDVGDVAPGPGGVLLLEFGQLNGIGVGAAEYARALLRPSNCGEYFVSEPTAELDSLLTAAQLLDSWMSATLAGAKPELSSAEARELFKGLRACVVSGEALDSLRVR